MRQSRTPPGAAAPSRAGSGLGAGGYITLFSVQFQHAFYNAAGNRCPDLAVVPTADCARLMASVGMLFQDQGDGFTIAIPRERLPALGNCILDGFSGATPGQGYWSRLSFFLLLKNPYFVGITAMPIGASPTTQNFYASNLQTSPAPDGPKSGAGADRLQVVFSPVTGPTVSVKTRLAATVSLRAISGAVVSSAQTRGGKPVTLSLAGAPYGLYTVSCTAGSGYTGPATVAYGPTAPLTFGMIDLLLTQPAAGQGDPAVFPVAAPASPPPAGWQPTAASITPVNLVLGFDARATYWQYYVVAQDARSRLSETLSVTGTGATFRQSQAALPGGESAVLFTADTPLPLRQHTTYRFKLTGSRDGPDGTRDDIRVEWLPSAPKAPVWPAASGDSLTGCSEIYVYV